MLLAEIVFASRLLGLVAGEQQIDVQVDAAVHSIEVQRDGVTVAALHKVPWSAVVDFGPELAPHEVTVIGFDRAGNELGRDSQAVNVARPHAEIGVLLDRDANGQTIAAVRWNHFAQQYPRSVVVKLDRRVIRKGSTFTTFPLGVVDMSKIHVVDVEVAFPDGVRARKEVAFGGSAGYSEQVPSEMTPVGVRLRKGEGETTIDCLRVGDQSLPAVKVERGEGVALFILNGGRGVLKRVDAPEYRGVGLYGLHDADIAIMNPVAEVIESPTSVTRIYNSQSVKGGTQRVLATTSTPQGMAQITDAVGAAALRALQGGQRRVVVVVIGNAPAPDMSVHAPGSMRRYLERIGVPLRVWSLVGARPDLAETWGEVRDISTTADLLAATEDLRRELDSQRIAWVPLAPLHAVRVVADADCAYEPLAGAGYKLKSSDDGLTPLDRAASAR
jgi:hypothetical protein